MLAKFSSVVDAAGCAAEIQKGLKLRNDELLENREMQFCISLELVDVVEKEDRIYVDGVKIGVRVEGFAEAAGIWISRMTYDHVKKSQG